MSKTTEKSWKIATNKCKEFGLNILILKKYSEKLNLLSIHDSYEYGSEWFAISDTDGNCSLLNNNNEKSLFYDCEFSGICYPYTSMQSKINIICQKGKKYLCEKIIEKKDPEDLIMTPLRIESITKEIETQIINCNQTIHNATYSDTICDSKIKINLEIRNQIKTNNDTFYKMFINEPSFLSLKFLIIIFSCFFVILIIIICCSRKCFQHNFHSNIDTTIIFTDKL